MEIKEIGTKDQPEIMKVQEDAYALIQILLCSLDINEFVGSKVHGDEQHAYTGSLFIYTEEPAKYTHLQVLLS